MADADNAPSKTETEAARKVAVITGASSGIGRATALEFARRGYGVILTARRQSELEQTANECEKVGATAVAVAADTTDEAALQKVAKLAETTFGGFDVWINNAAVSAYGPFLDIPVEDFRRILDTNVMGYVHGARLALRQFRSNGQGTLVNVSSADATAPVPYSSPYVTSKYAIRGLSESLRMELQVEGLANAIHVCTVLPASTDTNLYQNAANYMRREVQAIEPVYDAAYVAKQIVRLAEQPRREVIIGPAGRAMAMEFSLMPRLYEQLVGRFINLNNFNNQPTGETKGNLYRPVETNRGIEGGWGDRRIRADTLNIMLGTSAAVVAGLLGAGYLAVRRGISSS